jgi:hypothetical protein
MRRQTVTIISALLLAHCGVEVGNPGGEKPKTGMINISFATETGLSNESLSLDISSLDISESVDSDAIIKSLTPSVSSIDLYGLQDSGSVSVAEASDMPAGSYSQIVVRLIGDEPVKYRDRDGKNRAVALEEKESKAFYINQSFVVTEGETTSIVISIDPYKSLENDDDKLIFRPHGHAKNRNRGVRYEGETKLVGAEWVCAYAYDVQVPPPSGGKMFDYRLDDKSPPSVKGPPLLDRKVFGTKADVVKDESDNCDNAFARAPIEDGKFRLRNLVPATYSFRYFAEDGTFEDNSDDVVLTPEEKP